MQKKRQQAANEPAADSLAPQYPIESVDNALKLLLLLGEQPQIRLSEATRYLGVASSTAHRLLAMLTYRGFVRQDPVSKAYLPGPSLTGVAFAIFSRIDIQGSATPIMRSSVRPAAGNDSRRDARRSQRPLCRRRRGPGRGPGRLPIGAHDARALHLDGQGHVGPVVAAGTASLLPHEQLERITAASIGSRAELEAELSRIRERGYAINREESEEGVASVAVPIPTRAPGLRLALNAAAPTHRLDSSQHASVAAVLVKAAKEIGDQLG